jgi:hypothetical protein
MELESGQRLRSRARGPTLTSRRRVWLALLVAMGLCVAGCIATTTLSLRYLSIDNKVVLSSRILPRFNALGSGTNNMEDGTGELDNEPSSKDSQMDSAQAGSDTSSVASVPGADLASADDNPIPDISSSQAGAKLDRHPSAWKQTQKIAFANGINAATSINCISPEPSSSSFSSDDDGSLASLARSGSESSWMELTEEVGRLHSSEASSTSSSTPGDDLAHEAGVIDTAWAIRAIKAVSSIQP